MIDDRGIEQDNGVRNLLNQKISNNPELVPDYKFYEKMWDIDPVMAKDWFDKRIEKLTLVIDSCKEEIKSLQKMMHLPDNKMIHAYYKATDKVSTTGIAGLVGKFFRENAGVKLNYQDIFNYLKTQGVNCRAEKQSIYSRVNYLCLQKKIKKVSVGTFIYESN